MYRIIAKKFIIAVVILAGIGGYTFYEFRYVRQGPFIAIDSPINGKIVSTPVADITGRVQNMNRIRMNDRDIAVNEQGVFNEKFVLSNGSNVVKVVAEDRFGRQSEALVEITYNEPSESLSKR